MTLFGLVSAIFTDHVQVGQPCFWVILNLKKHRNHITYAATSFDCVPHIIDWSFGKRSTLDFVNYWGCIKVEIDFIFVWLEFYEIQSISINFLNFCCWIMAAFVFCQLKKSKSHIFMIFTGAEKPHTKKIVVAIFLSCYISCVYVLIEGSPFKWYPLFGHVWAWTPIQFENVYKTNITFNYIVDSAEGPIIIYKLQIAIILPVFNTW